MGCTYKLLAKCPSIATEEGHGIVIFYNYKAFNGKAILDAFTIANEIADSRLKDGTLRVIYKLDTDKIYNHASYNFLIYVMEIMCYGVN